MSLFLQQHHTRCTFQTADSWVILSPIEQSIKQKIESVGKPLKEWDIKIYRGVLTGCNEAFIIDTEKRDEILANCKSEDERTRTAELIRPILRGRDIKRYGYEWAGLYLINTHNGVRGKIPRIEIDDYPAIKSWLDKGGVAYNGNMYKGFAQIAKRADKGDTPYNLRNCAYMDLFFQPKICWKAVGRRLAFALVKPGIFLTSPASFISAGNFNELILAYLCSSIGTYFFYQNSDTTGAGDIMLNIQSLIKFPIVPECNENLLKAIKSKDDDEIDNAIFDMYKFTLEERTFIYSQIS